METTPTRTGNAKAVPEPIEEKIQFTTPEEMEKFEGLLDKSFVRADGTDKNFIWKIVSMHPAQPAGSEYLGDDFVVQFGIQKFDKTKVRIDDKNGTKVRYPTAVQAWDENGRCLDPWANKFIDANEFLKKFKREVD